MKALLSICMLFMSSFVVAGEMPAAPSAVVTGVVLEVKSVSNFSYLRLKTNEGEIWAAIVNTPIKEGASVTIENAIVMNNFESKGLNKTFPMIVFGSLRGASEKASGGASKSALGLSMFGASGLAINGLRQSGNAMGTMTPTMPAQQLETIKNVRVPKAQGANAYTVEEINKKAVALKDKSVVVRGKVVKYNPGIMGRNWIHLRDGSGSAQDESDDILVTSKSEANLGDVVTAKGVVHNDKEFGAGYAYKVLIEDATLQQ